METNEEQSQDGASIVVNHGHSACSASGTLNSRVAIHYAKLNQMCRLCSASIKYEKQNPYAKDRFHADILNIFGINVQDESPNEYPKYICRRDGREIYKIRSGQKQISNSFLKDLKPQMLFNCNEVDRCSVCKPNKQSRKRKSSGRSSPVKKKRVKGEVDNIPLKDLKESEETETINESWSSHKHDKCGTDSQILNILHKYISKLSHEAKIEFICQLFNIVNQDDVNLMSYLLGKRISSQVYEDGQNFSLFYKDLKSMANFDCLEWVKQRNETMLSFLLGVGNLCQELSYLRDSKQTILSITRAMEQIYMVNNNVIISPLAFMMNISAYSLSGSSTLVDMIGNANPAAHYKTVTEWLRDQNCESAVIPPGDILNVFDNEQVIGRKHAIKPSSKAPISIITNKCYCCLDPDGNLQGNSELKPSQILNLTDHESTVYNDNENGNDEDKKLKTVVEEIISESSSNYYEHEKVHSDQLAYFIQSAIDSVVSEQSINQNEIIDDFDIIAAKESLEDNMVQCSCGEWNSLRKIVCSNCKKRDGLKKARESKKNSAAEEYHKQRTTFKRITFENVNIDSDNLENTTIIKEEEIRYSHVKSNHKKKHEICIMDPVFCNPNSLETVARVLRMIGVENGIVRYGGDVRHWTFICCDGLPYLICKKLKDEAVVCIEDNCNKKFLTQKDFLKHVTDEHPTIQQCKFIHEFDWFYLKIGSGHYEMNLLKSFFELNWTPFLEALCEKMGFLSDSAKQYAKACKDTHKAWNLLLVFHLGSLRELVLPYVRDCLKNETTPVVKGFLKFSQRFYCSNEYPNYQYFFLQVTRFSQAIINFRMAVRRNNSDLLKSSKYMTKELFHGRSHPKYQAIEVYDTIQDMLMPNEVKKLNDAYSSITTTGNPSTGEDFDFILEEKNRQVKSWIPKGVPSDTIWLNVCRNNDKLEKLKRSSLSLLGINTSESKVKKIDLEDAIGSYRCLLRKSKYLDKSGDLSSLSGLALDNGLVDMLRESTKRRIYFIRTEILKEDIDVPLLRHPIAITPEEKCRLTSDQNMTVEELRNEIIRLIQLITDPLQYDFHHQLYKSDVKNKNKARHIQFLQQLRDALTCDDNPHDEESIGPSEHVA